MGSSAQSEWTVQYQKGGVPLQSMLFEMDLLQFSNTDV